MSNSVLSEKMLNTFNAGPSYLANVLMTKKSHGDAIHVSRNGIY